MKKTIVVIIFLIAQAVCSQTWEREIGYIPNKEECANTICKLSNGTYIIGGYAEAPDNSNARILNISTTGDTLWSKLVLIPNCKITDLSSSIALPDNTFLISGKCIVNFSITGFVAKYDSYGNNIWSRNYYSYNLDYSIIELIRGNDNGFLCTSLNFLLKINDEGVLQWIKSSADYNAGSVYGFKPYDSNSFIGASANFPNPGFGILKINNNGELIWQKETTNYLSPEYLYLFSNKIFVFGSVQDTATQALILKMQTYDIHGNYITSKSHNVNRQEITGGLYLPINNNRFIVSSNNLFLTTDTSHCELRLLDSNLILINKLDLTTKAGFRGLYSAVKQDEKYFLAAGNISLHLGYGYEDFYVIKSDTNLNLQVSIGISKIETEIPKEIYLYQNFPNPFNPFTKIRFSVPEESYVKIEIYDITGRMIERIAEKKMSAGTYETGWDGSSYPSGIYFCKMKAGEVTRTVKMVLVK